MIIELTKDSNRRTCSICRRNIKKKSVIVKYEYIIDSWKNTRIWFAHIDCLINKLISTKKLIDVELEKIPKIKVEIHRKEAR